MNFDELINRTDTYSSRWQGRGDTISLTIGDSDFRMPGPVQAALERRVHDGVLGYDTVPDSLKDLIAARLWLRYQWQIELDWLVFLPGVVQGLNLCCRGLTQAGDSVISETPIYYPFLDASAQAAREMARLPAKLDSDRWVFDLQHFSQIASKPDHSLLLFCNPQNPLGRVSTQQELTQMAEICQREGVVICSDEIHCDVLFDDHQHQPVAAIDPDIAEITVTLMGPSKAFGISGLGGAFAIIPSADVRAKFQQAAAGLLPNLHALAIAGMEAAYAECDDWLAEEVRYLQANRDLACNVLGQIPGVSLTQPEGTYFLWLDFSQSGVNDPYQSLLDAGVELSTGDKFGDSGFLRLNFASPVERLEQALDRIVTKLSR